ncbi:endonuclease/exonuclease/phosphatase family protein [Flavobacterium sp.]|uniref:endonuclease/exonuclease/phosphatase family protein n=1 Tax=Flavobacterium sp. TaxID=239 RepID=UPI0039E5A764
MKKITLLLLLFLTAAPAQELKIMSYNLRVDFGGDGENNWEFRRDFLAGQLGFYEPDFIGTQEGKAHQLQFIDSLLTDYTYFGLSRDNSKSEGEFCAIFYNQKKFKLLQDATFWLSETPDQKSKGWDAAYERICTYGLFEDLKTKKHFYVFNTHLDHIGEMARENGVKLIIEKINAINTKKLPVILTGDFNSETKSEAYQTISKTMNDSRIVCKTKPFGPSGTFNGFKFHEPVKLLIDYIFVSKGIEVEKYSVLSDSKDCKYPSDHLPVLTQIKLP